MCGGKVDLDAVTALAVLAERRPVFHSERDFQPALAWQACVEHLYAIADREVIPESANHR